MTTLTLNSEQDSYVDLANPATNYGSATTMIAGSYGANAKYALIDFDLEQVPDHAYVQRAIINLYCTAVNGTVNPFGIWALASMWAEGTLVAANLPAAATGITQFTAPTGAGAWSVDVAPALRLQTQFNYVKHFGIEFLPSTAAMTGTVTFATKEHATPAWRPTLSIDYYTKKRILPKVSGPLIYSQPRFAVTTLKRAYTEGAMLDLELVAPNLGVSTFDLVFSDQLGAEERFLNELIEDQNNDVKVWIGDGAVWTLGMRGLMDLPGNINSSVYGRCCEIRGRGHGSLLTHRRRDASYSALWPADVIADAMTNVTEVSTGGVIDPGIAVTVNGNVLPNVKGILDVVQAQVSTSTQPWGHNVCNGEHGFEQSWIAETKPTLHFAPRTAELSSEILRVNERHADFQSARLIRDVINQLKIYYDDMASSYTKEDTASEAKYTVRAGLQWLDAITSATEAQNWTDAYIVASAEPAYNIRVLPGGFTLALNPGELIVYRDWVGVYLLRVARVIHRFTPDRAFTEIWIN